MIDLHCHILPGMDDGAQELREAVGMLHMERASGVDRLFLTPHFYPEEEGLDVFLSRRRSAWEELCSALTPRECESIRLGAEVRYCEKLLSLDLRKLTLGDSDYLLLELPGLRYPTYAVQIMEELLGRGLIPILAHVERCAYFREEPELLKRLVDLGVLAQVSALALFDRRDKHFSIACLSHGLAQLVSSDAHSTTDRKPCMELVQRLPVELQQCYEVFSEAVWGNELPEYFRAGNVKKTIFGYR